MTMHLVRGMTTINTKKRKGKKLNLEKLELEWRRYNKDMRRRTCTHVSSIPYRIMLITFKVRRNH